MRCSSAIAALLLLQNPARTAPVASNPTGTELPKVLARLDAQEAELATLHERLAASEAGVLAPATAEEPLGCGDAPDEPGRPWATATPQPSAPAPCEAVAGVDPAAAAADAWPEVRYVADYDNGLRMRPVDPARDPLALRVGGGIPFRRHAFRRDVVAGTDNAGVVRPVENRTAFDIDRGRLLFSGFALDERLTYFLQLDRDADGSETVDCFDRDWA